MQYSNRATLWSRLVVLVALAAAIIVPDAHAQFFHGASIQKNPLGPTGFPKAHVGEVITTKIRVRNLDDYNDSLTITNIHDEIHHTSGDEITTNLLTLQGTNVQLFLTATRGTNGVDSSGIVSSTNDVILLSRLDSVIVTHYSTILPGDAPTAPFLLFDDAIASGWDNHDGADVSEPSYIRQDFIITFPGQIRVLYPCLQISKNCVNGTGDGSIVWTGTLTNCGNATNFNVVVSNLVNGVMSLVYGPATLMPGQVVFITNSYPGGCVPTTDTLFASGVDELGSNLTATATATCSNLVVSGIVVTKSCPANPVAPGALLSFTGSVSNSGNVTLTNVLVVNNQPTNNTPVFGPVTLLPGQSASFGGSYTTPSDACGPWNDTLTARGLTPCSVLVSNNASATCASTITAGIVVTKNCPANPVAPGGLLVFTGSVSNTGNVTLTNVVVVNNQPTNNTPVFGPTTLAPGAVRLFTNSYTVPSDACGPWIDTLTASARSICGSNVTAQATANCLAVTAPSLVVTKACPASPVALGGVLTFTGTVTNTGNITLTNVVVVDDQPAPGTLVFSITNLAPGAGRAFTNSYTVPLDFCGPAIDTLTATATSKCGSNISHTATATCPIVTTPIIRVTKNCPASPVAPGGLIVFSGTVSNAGNITLTNVIIVDNQPTNNAPVFGPVTLAPGQSATYTGSYRAPLDTCGPLNDIVTATARSICGSNVSHTASASCPVITTPRISITKRCPAAPTPFGGLLVYSGTVSNNGNITLTNVFVFDNKPTNNSPVVGPIILAPGQSVTFTNSYSVLEDCCGPYDDTLTATARSICGSNVVKTATAVCPGITYPCLNITRTCPTGAVTLFQSLPFSGIVSNCGNVTLSNIVVVGNDGTVFMAMDGFAPGEWMDYTSSFTPTNCGPNVTNIVTITGNDICSGARVSSTAICIINCTSGQANIILSPSLLVTKFGLSFPSQAGKSYTVQFANTLASPVVNWQPLTNVTGDGSVLTIYESRTNAYRYYRVLQNP